MSAIAQEVSKLADRYQTTIPSGVRRQLRLEKGIRFATAQKPTVAFTSSLRK